jgi:hypothetical protein
MRSVNMNRALRLGVRALRLGVLVSVTSAISINAQAIADSLIHPVSARHRLAACMSTQMSASKTLSYNAATKVCKAQLAEAQLRSQSPTLASSPATR